MNKDIIKNVGFPDQLASDEEKNTEAYGLSYAKAVESEWFKRPTDGTCQFYDRMDKYHNLRLYARGEQSTKIYKDLLNGGEDTSYVNFDFRPLQVVPKFVNLVVNQMSERLFNIKAEATDKFSTNLKDSFKKDLERLVIAKPIIQAAKNTIGVDVAPDNYDEYPQSQEEVDLYMQLKYKPAIEIACEEAIKFTMDLNDYTEIQSKVIEDITTIGIGAVKHRTDINKGIMVEYVDPANTVYSYPKHRNFKNVYYYGEVERITINELKRLSGDKFTDDQLKEIAEQSTDFYKYQGNSNENASFRNGDLENTMLTILHFTYKTTNTITYKKNFSKNGGFTMNKRESTFKKGEYVKEFDVVKKTIDVWYEGTLVLGTDHLISYGLCENMIRPEGYLNITEPNYVFYAPELYQGRTKSLVERIIPYVDQMQQIHIKLQQLIAKSRPNGIYIDVDGLNEIDMGDGNFLTPLELLKIYDETGNVLGASVTGEGDYNYGRQPIQELKNGIVDGLDRLIGAYNHYLNLLRDAIGIPIGSDASMPHPDTLVGVQQQVALNSNTATRHILDSSLDISQRLGKGISLRLKDIFKYSYLGEVYMNAIGKTNVTVLQALKKYHLHDLGITIQLKPDIQEKQYLEANINTALAAGIIVLDDAIDIRNVQNIKLANELLKIRRVRREKEKQENAEKLAKINGENQTQSIQAAAQSKMEEIKAQTEAELQVINAKKEAKKEEILTEKNAKSELMYQEFFYNMKIKGIEVTHDTYKSGFVEDKKTERQLAQNEHDLKMNGQPISQSNTPNQSSAQPSFESSEDNITGGMDLGELEPQ